MSGGFNGWWIQPSDRPTEITITWTPQRAVTIGLILSLLAVLGCIALAIRSRRGASGDTGSLTGSTEPPTLTRTILLPTSRRTAVTSAVVLTVGATLIVSPAYGVLAAVVAVAIVLTRRPVIAGLAAVVLAGALGAFVLQRQLRFRFFASAAWPSNFEILHQAGLLVVVLLAASMWPHERATTAPDETVDDSGDDDSGDDDAGAPTERKAVMCSDSTG